MTSLHLVSLLCQWKMSHWLWRGFAFWSLQTSRAWLPSLSGWKDWWTSPCSREVTFSFQSHGKFPAPAHATQLWEVGTHHILWCMRLDTCFRQGTHHLSLTRWELSPSAGLGRAIPWRSAFLSPTRLILSLCALFAIPQENRQREEGR